MTDYTPAGEPWVPPAETDDLEGCEPPGWSVAFALYGLVLVVAGSCIAFWYHDARFAVPTPPPPLFYLGLLIWVVGGLGCNAIQFAKWGLMPAGEEWPIPCVWAWVLVFSIESMLGRAILGWIDP